MSLSTLLAGVAVLFVSMLVLLEIGRRLGRRDYANDPEGVGKGLSPLAGALFGLMGLLLAFTFSGAGSRFDDRRHLIVEEANDIGTAYLRLNLLPPSTQPKLRDSFRQYLDARLDYYKQLAVDPVAAQASMDRTLSIGQDIWGQAVAATGQLTDQANANAVTSLVMQSLNDVIDIATTRSVALQIHPPAAVYLLLGVLILACSLMAGYETAARKTRSWIHILGFCVIVAGSVLLVLDYEFPRFGLIRVDSTDQVLMDVRNRMH